MCCLAVTVNFTTKCALSFLFLLYIFFLKKAFPAARDPCRQKKNPFLPPNGNTDRAVCPPFSWEILPCWGWGTGTCPWDVALGTGGHLWLWRGNWGGEKTCWSRGAGQHRQDPRGYMGGDLCAVLGSCCTMKL